MQTMRLPQSSDFYKPLNPAEVKAMQQKLNVVLVPSPRLALDGVMGPGTKQAIRTFQKKNWLVEDGQPGPATMNALFNRETDPPVLYNLPFFPQPSITTGWAAATAMLTSSTVPAVIARTPRDLVRADGRLVEYTNKNQSDAASLRFAQAHGLRIYPPTSWITVPPLRSALVKGPLMFDMLWELPGEGNQGHLLVIGIRGDGKKDTTTLRIFDPYPPNVAAPYSSWYHRWVLQVPGRTRRVFQR